MANIGWNADLAWGENSWGDLSDVSVSLSGIGLTVAQGTATATAELNTGWGRETGWGTEDWGTDGISVIAETTGLQLDFSVGTATLDANSQIDATGSELAMATGFLDPEPDVIPTGSQVNIALDDVTVLADSDAVVTGSALTITSGTATLDANTQVDLTGNGLAFDDPGTVVVGGIARIFPDGVETGIFEPGDVTFTITGSVIPDGSQLNTTTGTAVLDANTQVDVTGIELNTATGNLTFTISGSVELTGNALEIALGEENVQVWTQVDTGTSVAYSEVSTGSSVTWTEVDTAA